MRPIILFAFTSVIWSIYLVTNANGLSCLKRRYPDGYVCVCDDTYCDTLDAVDNLQRQTFVLISSSKEGLRFNVEKGEMKLYEPNTIIVGEKLKKRLKIRNNRRRNGIYNISIKVNRRKSYQKFMGFGGALTGTVSYLLSLAPKTIQNQFYKSYYSNSSGIGYSFLRMPIGASDFDWEPWAYNVRPTNDYHLSNFTQLDYRDLLKVSQIKDLQRAAHNYAIQFIGAAWSCPPWMKTKSEWTGRDFLRPEFYQTWADYHMRFLELMDNQGVRFWALSTGNEPFNAVIAWLFVLFLDLGWTAENQGKWVGANLGPTLRASKFSDVKLLGLDDQRYQLAWWFQDMDKAYPQSTSYLDGIAVHWYRDKMVPSTFLDYAHDMYPDKFIINSESCIVGTPKLGSWERAERYIRGIIEDFTHWVTAWIDWNLMVDEVGGPNYARNFVDAPIIYNSTGKEFYKQPIYYAIGHFSRFITPNSTRIDVISSREDIPVVGFRRPDDSVALILYNKFEQVINMTVIDDDQMEFHLIVPPRSIHTLVYLN